MIYYKLMRDYYHEMECHIYPMPIRVAVGLCSTGAGATMS